MSVNVTYLEELKESMKEYSDKAKEYSDKYDTAYKELQQKCPHTTYSVDRTYFSGGYDYVSSVSIVEKCTFCKKVLKHYDDPKHRGYHG